MSRAGSLHHRLLTSVAVSEKVRLKSWWLMVPYVVVLPVMVLLAADVLMGIEARSWLPSRPNQVFLLAIFFENPHIVASLLIFADRGYLRHYKYDLKRKICITIGLCAVVGLIFGLSGFLSFFYAWTVWHVIRQQIGIGRMFNRQPSWLYDVWGWCFMTSSLVVALLIGVPEFQTSLLPKESLRFVSMIVCALSVCLAIGLSWSLKQRLAKIFLGLNSLLILMALACVLMGYPLLAVLLPRIIHDVTAYIIYVNHDTNRNRVNRHNLLYRYTAPYFSIWITCLVVSISLAAWVTFTPTYTAFSIGIGLALLHYTTESFTWKHGSLHRQHFSLAHS